MKKINKYTMIAAITGVLLLILLLSFNGCQQSSQEDNTGKEMQAVEAKPGSVSVVVEGPSVVEPYLMQTVRSRIDGVVIKSPMEGDFFSEGDVMVRFDSSEQQKAVRQAQIVLEQARINREKADNTLKKAETDLSNKQKLFKSGAVPQEQVDIAKNDLDTAVNSLKLTDLSVSQAVLSLETAEADKAATIVRAPFNGVVLSTELNPGVLINRSAELLIFADLSRVRLRAEVDEYDINKIQTGQSVSITGEAIGDKPLTSTVERISPAAEVINNISIFRVSTVLDNEAGLLKPGMSADISILISSDKGLIVPSRAVSTVRNRSYVKVFKEDEIKTRRISVGADDGINVAVLDGLEEGELVVVSSSGGFSLTTSKDSAGTSVVPITVPGTGGTR